MKARPLKPSISALVDLRCLKLSILPSLLLHLSFSVVISLSFLSWLTVVCVSCEGATLLEIEHVHRGRMYGGLSSNDVASRIGIHSKSGAIFIAGTTRAHHKASEAWGDFDSEYSDSNRDENDTGTDIFLAKLKPDGDLQWIRRFGVGGNDSLGDMAVSSSAVFLCGKTGTSLDRSSRGDVFVAKYSLNGQPLWERPFQLSSIGRDKCNAIAVRGDRDVYIGGYTTGLLFSAESIGQAAQPPGFEYTPLNQAFIAHLRERNTSDLRSPVEINTAPSDAPPLTDKELVVVRGRQKYGYGDAAVDFLAVVFNRLVYTTSVTYRGRMTSYLHDADPESISPWHMQTITTSVGMPSLTVRFVDEADNTSVHIDHSRRTGSTLPSNMNMDTPNLLHGHIGGFRVTGMHVTNLTQDVFVVGCDADADTTRSGTGTGTGWVAITVLKYGPAARAPTWVKALTSGMVLPDPAHMQLHSPKIAVDVHSHSVYVHVYLPSVLSNSMSSNSLSADTSSALDSRLPSSSLSSLDSNSEPDDDGLDSDDGGDGERESVGLLHSVLFVLDERSGDVVRVWNRWDEQEDVIRHTAVDHTGFVMFAGMREHNAWVGSFGSPHFVSVADDSVITTGSESDPDFQSLFGEEDGTQNRDETAIMYVIVLSICAVIVLIACCVCKQRPVYYHDAAGGGGW